jgi:nucleoside-diphosphate-sugar epimerase
VVGIWICPNVFCTVLDPGCHRENLHGLWTRSIGPYQVGPLRDYIAFARGCAPLSSGVRLVDWIYVDDVVDGLIGCAQTTDIDGRTVELGSGEMHSIREIVEQLANLVACPADPLFGALPDRPFERIRKADIAGSYKLIGWQPSTSLGSGLTRTIEWYKKQAELIR